MEILYSTELAIPLYQVGLLLLSSLALMSDLDQNSLDFQALATRQASSMGLSQPL